MKNRISILVVGVALVGCLQDSPEAYGVDSSPAGSATSQPTNNPTNNPTSRATEKPRGNPAEKVADAEKPEKLDEDFYQHFGDGVAAEGESQTVAAIAARSKEFADKKVRLEGIVQSVCKKQGCWMVLAEGDKSVRVKFRDYGFFVPLDCEGREAVVEGTFSVSETSIADLKHLLQDEGKHDEAAKITEPKVEMKVMADGVALRKTKKG